MAPESKISNISNIRVSLNSILEDVTIPKNIKLKINGVIEILNSNSEMSLRINKGLNELEEIGNGTNLNPYLRTQVWNIITTLEKMLTLVE